MALLRPLDGHQLVVLRCTSAQYFVGISSDIGYCDVCVAQYFVGISRDIGYGDVCVAQSVVGLTACGGVGRGVFFVPSHAISFTREPPSGARTMGTVTLQTIFQDAYPLYEQTHLLPTHVCRAARAIMQCRTAALGGHV